MNNLSSYCGLVDAKIRASEKDLPVRLTTSYKFNQCFQTECFPATSKPLRKLFSNAQFEVRNLGKGFLNAQKSPKSKVRGRSQTTFTRGEG